MIETIFLGLPLVGLVASVVYVVRRGGPSKPRTMDRDSEQARAEGRAWESRLGNSMEL